MLLPGSEGRPPKVEPPPVRPGVNRASRQARAPHGYEMRAVALSTVQDTEGWWGVIDLVRERSGIAVLKIAERMGVANWSIQQYVSGDRGRLRAPRGGCSVEWFVRYVEACGGQVVIHVPAVETEETWRGGRGIGAAHSGADKEK